MRWNSTLAADELLVLVALTAPPLSLSGPGGRQATLDAALRAGLPLAVWDRRPTPPGDFRKRVDKWLRRVPTELSIHVRQLSNQMLTGRDVGFVWDDPDRMVD